MLFLHLAALFFHFPKAFLVTPTFTPTVAAAAGMSFYIFLNFTKVAMHMCWAEKEKPDAAGKKFHINAVSCSAYVCVAKAFQVAVIA